MIATGVADARRLSAFTVGRYSMYIGCGRRRAGPVVLERCGVHDEMCVCCIK